MRHLDPEFLELTARLDVDAFWAENQQCYGFTSAKPRCAFEFAPDDHWIFELVAVPSTLRYYHDKAYRDDLHRRVNEITRTYLGQAFFDQDTFQHAPRRIENLFGSEFVFHEGSTPWLQPATDDPGEFARILDRAEASDLRTWAFPDEFLAEWEQRRREGRTLLQLGTGSRGPATVMTSVLKVETAIYWMIDRPDLMRRFRDLLAAKMIELNRELRRFSDNQEPGWWITDDNSALLNRALYRDYCLPVLTAVLAALAPGSSRRYQHSDSAMGHLLAEQRELGINEVNYGPTVDAALIRSALPDALIRGHMPPFLLRNGSPAEIRDRVIEDFARAGETGGLLATTAGSLAAGTSAGRMRWYMQLVQTHCRYD